MKRLDRSQYFALIIAVSVFIFAFIFMQARKQRILEQQTLMSVIIAKKDIAKGEVILSDQLSTSRIPKAYLQPHFIREKEEIVGSIALVPLFSGEQMMRDKTMFPSKEIGLAWKIIPGSRALSVEIDDVSGLAGLIRPNDFVDLLSTLMSSDQRAITQTVVQNVQVLAVGSDMGSAISSSGKNKERWLSGEAQDLAVGRKKTLTLLLSPDEVEKVEWAKNVGKISFALRGREDQSE